MRFRKIIPLFIFYTIGCCHTIVYAQPSPPSQYKDSPSEIEIPTEEQLFKDDPDPVVLSAQIAVRLKKIQQTIPLDYNEQVQKYITYNTDERRKTHLSKMLGRSNKFFPIFEPILQQYGIPDEMKYLSVVESALNPFALSKMGASGPWQFMYSTALRYELNISKRIDERRDPYASCEAAAKYLKEMYNLYGSWQLAIASYNCGAGNVNKAIKKAGGSTNFWDIRPYLPAETRAYVPSFIAIVYAMKYAGKYGISPLVIERENTQRVTVRQKITVNDLESLLKIPRQIIIDENPSLLTTYIPPDFILNLPASKITAFEQHQDSMYQYALYAVAEQKLQTPYVINPASSAKETLAEDCIDEEDCKDDFSTKPIIKDSKPTASKTDKKVEVKEESLYQKVKGMITPGSEKKDEEISSGKTAKTVSKGSATAPKTNPKQEAETTINTEQKNIKPTLFKEDDNNYKTIAYSVKKGDNLGNIAEWFHCNVKEIRRWNDLHGNLIDVNDELLIYVHKNDYKKFVRFNYLSKNIKDDLSKKITTQEEADAVKKSKELNAQVPLIDKINPVKILSKKECFQSHRIKDGETLWSIAQKYDEVTVQDLMLWNGYKRTPVLHKGDEIKVRKIKCN